MIRISLKKFRVYLGFFSNTISKHFIYARYNSFQKSIPRMYLCPSHVTVSWKFLVFLKPDLCSRWVQHQKVISWSTVKNQSNRWFAKERHLVDRTQHWQKTSVSCYSIQNQLNIHWVYSSFAAQGLNGGWSPCGARLQAGLRLSLSSNQFQRWLSMLLVDSFCYIENKKLVHTFARRNDTQTSLCN